MLSEETSTSPEQQLQQQDESSVITSSTNPVIITWCWNFLTSGFLQNESNTIIITLRKMTLFIIGIFFPFGILGPTFFAYKASDASGDQFGNLLAVSITLSIWCFCVSLPSLIFIRFCSSSASPSQLFLGYVLWATVACTFVVNHFISFFEAKSFYILLSVLSVACQIPSGYILPIVTTILILLGNVRESFFDGLIMQEQNSFFIHFLRSENPHTAADNPGIRFFFSLMDILVAIIVPCVVIGLMFSTRSQITNNKPSDREQQHAMMQELGGKKENQIKLLQELTNLFIKLQTEDAEKLLDSVIAQQNPTNSTAAAVHIEHSTSSELLFPSQLLSSLKELNTKLLSWRPHIPLRLVNKNAQQHLEYFEMLLESSVDDEGRTVSSNNSKSASARLSELSGHIGTKQPTSNLNSLILKSGNNSSVLPNNVNSAVAHSSGNNKNQPKFHQKNRRRSWEEENETAEETRKRLIKLQQNNNQQSSDSESEGNGFSLFDYATKRKLEKEAQKKKEQQQSQKDEISSIAGTGAGEGGTEISSVAPSSSLDGLIVGAFKQNVLVCKLSLKKLTALLSIDRSNNVWSFSAKQLIDSSRKVSRFMTLLNDTARRFNATLHCCAGDCVILSWNAFEIQQHQSSTPGTTKMGSQELGDVTGGKVHTVPNTPGEQEEMSRSGGVIQFCNFICSLENSLQNFLLQQQLQSDSPNKKISKNNNVVTDTFPPHLQDDPEDVETNQGSTKKKERILIGGAAIGSAWCQEFKNCSSEFFLANFTGIESLSTAYEVGEDQECVSVCSSIEQEANFDFEFEAKSDGGKIFSLIGKQK